MIVTIHELSFEATGHFHVARHPLLDCRIQFGVSCHAMESTIGSRRSRGNELKPLNSAHRHRGHTGPDALAHTDQHVVQHLMRAVHVGSGDLSDQLAIAS
jgi:hypothetical protein